MTALGTEQAPPTPEAPVAGPRQPDRASARAFVDAHIAPYADDWDRQGALPGELLGRLGEAGLWAPFLPAGLGGSGISMVALGEVHEEVGRGCSSVRSLLTVHTMVAWALKRWGTAEQTERWAPPLAAGEVLGAFCLSEPGAGSDTEGITTTATPDRGGWLLDGTKTWTTNGQRASLFLVFARVGASIAAFLVPRGHPGVRVEPLHDMLGTRAAMLATVTFDQVRLGPDALLGPAGFTSGMVLTGTLDLGRYSVAAGCVGIVQACLEASAAHAAGRYVGGRPLEERQLVQARLSDMVTDARAARLLCAEAGRLKDAADPGTIMATWVAKYFASTAAARHASAAVQIHGAAGCAPGSPVARHYRDAKVMEIIEGSTEIQQTTIAAQAHRDGTR